MLRVTPELLARLDLLRAGRGLSRLELLESLLDEPRATPVSEVVPIVPVSRPKVSDPAVKPNGRVRRPIPPPKVRPEDCDHPRKVERHVGWGILCGVCGLRLR
jgi:hypothetical protein